jgi:outer membrane biosynthesis protein TonB
MILSPASDHLTAFFSLCVYHETRFCLMIATSACGVAPRWRCKRPMTFGRQFAISILGIVLFALAGCAKKKPQLPPQAKAPVDTVAVPLPDEISEAAPPPPQPAPKPQPVPQEPPKPEPTTHRKKKKQTPPPASTQSNPATPPVAGSSNNTLAAAHPPANPAAEAPADTAIAADVTSAQLSQQKQTTAQLLDATEKTVNGLNRTLSHDEEEVVSQIHSYVAQSRKATSDGDFERAYNLATKAHLLSDALVKK